MDHSTEIAHLQIEKGRIEHRIRKLTAPEDSHLAGVAKHFHLGMVGGSGKNTHGLNKRRERAMDKSIKVATELTGLHKELNTIEARIEDLEAGGPEKRASKEQERDQHRAAYWNNLKAGSTLDMGNGPLTITKKNKKSLITQSGCVYKAEEIIGRKAAALI